MTVLNGPTGYPYTAREIGTAVTTDFISKTTLFNVLLGAINTVLPVSGITEAGEAPLAVVGSAPLPGLFAFDKFSSEPFLQ